jgi:hypothetical protein
MIARVENLKSSTLADSNHSSPGFEAWPENQEIFSGTSEFPSAKSTYHDCSSELVTSQLADVADRFREPAIGSFVFLL